MINLNDVYSLTEFQRNAKERVEQLAQTGRPHVLTVNGKATLVVQDAAAYQALLEARERAETIAGIRRGLADVERGATHSAADVLSALRDTYESP